MGRLKIKEIYEKDPFVIMIEMASDRSKAKTRIIGLGKPLLEHLIKVLRWKDDINYYKHLKDIDSWIKQIYQAGRGISKEKDYFEWLFSERIRDVSDIQRVISHLEPNYDILTTIRSTDDVYNLLYDLYRQISVDLGKGNIIHIRDYL